jgi:hypothetical protein
MNNRQKLTNLRLLLEAQTLRDKLREHEDNLRSHDEGGAAFHIQDARDRMREIEKQIGAAQDEPPDERNGRGGTPIMNRRS